MAYDYNNYEKFYNAMNDSQRAKWNEQNKNDADFNDFMSKYNAKNQTSTPVSNVSNTTSTGKSSSQTAVPEYWGTWASNAKQSNYVNQWEGNYKYNPTTWYYEKQWTSTGTTTPTTPTQTSTTSTPSSVSTPKSDTISSMKEYWDSLDYAQQQEKLKANPSLKEWLARYGITSKTAPVESTWTTWDTGKTWWTTPADKWDYSDNSPERMAEIADNVNRFYNTNPGIFESEDSFRNFFIDWKGRTPEQEAFLMDFYKNRKKYNELDNYTADEIWAMDVHWYVPESYLTYLKNSDPERYAAVMDAKAKEQDKIKDKTSLETTNVMTWEDDENTITSKAIEWLKAQWLFVDKDWNFIDDRTENYATDEEKQYAKDAADIIARNLDIDNTVKHTYDDLVEKYPWATKATLMAMAQDINSDLLREKENNNVELTRLQWYMDYMQTERQERNKIWQNAIEQLQKQYGMYYTYSPEWMSELAQAQYAATNVTLDQADNWTDTQKQMALQSVLDDYYAKYWDIIQRSEAQVINDVMAYAKKNGVSLSQALEENFLKYLRQKPEFEILSSWRSISSTADKWAKLTDDLLFNTATWEIISAKGWWTSNWQLYWFTDYTPISTEQKESVLNNFMNTRTEGSDWWQCWEFVNDYLQALWYDRLYDDPIDKKKAVTNSDTATVWSIAVMDSQKYPQYWHVAIVTDVQWDKVKLLESNWNNDEKVHTTRWVNKSDIAGYFDPSKQPASESSQKWNPDLETFLDKWNEAAWDRLKEKDFWSTFWKELEDKWVSKEDFMNQYKEYHAYMAKDAYLEILQNLDHLIELTWKDFSKLERAAALIWTGDIWNLFDYIKNNLTLQNLSKVKGTWVNLWILSDSDVKMVAQAAAALDWDSSQESRAYALNNFRQQLLNNNKYLKDKYQVQSAYSTNKWFKYDNDSKTYTIWTRKTNSNQESNTQQQTSTRQAKTIKSMGKS